MSVNDFIKIGSRIKAYRQQAGFSQRQMAEKLNLSYSTYSNYENNYREPPSKVINDICEILEVDFPDLIGAGEPKLSESILDNISEKLKHIGYTLGGEESDGEIWINFPDGELSISSDDLLQIDEDSNCYLQFKLEELKKKHPKDFRPRKK